MVDRETLIQYYEIIEEIKDIQRRRENLLKEIGKLESAPDTGIDREERGNCRNIDNAGYAVLTDGRRNAAVHRYAELLERKETELLNLICQAEAQIERIKKSELRIMFRLHYIDGLSWVKVAGAMNQMFPKRQIRYTEENCKKRSLRLKKSLPMSRGNEVI